MTMASKAEVQQAREKARDDSRKPVPGIIEEICMGGRYQPPSDPEAKVAYEAEWRRQTS
ncbi:MAG: hypothetical protein HYT40_02785 [Candidatus Sungbacteria bacterium]|uniref:Uncharacterized protein n=1 Tax=Candidatus Sungiibacteriota bacterium TaxID=2750080 RepID=A0A931SCX1_9BACT|nr:hypothetical protein [Candidatus Sungbacteria bacterium]